MVKPMGTESTGKTILKKYNLKKGEVFSELIF